MPSSGKNSLQITDQKKRTKAIIQLEGWNLNVRNPRGYESKLVRKYTKERWKPE